MSIFLNPTEARVLGALVEKEATTPEYYPLSLNALVNACNQKNNRDPEMHLDEIEVRQALHRLEDQQLAGPVRGTESRVTKYEHRLQEVFNFTRGETAVLCVLLLRGPQTPGELRIRTERIHRFPELDDVLSALQRLMQREPSLATALPRQPGTKETRYTHLLSGDVEAVPIPTREETISASPNTQFRLESLETEVATLRQEILDLKEQLSALKSLSS
ncbi:MAG: YceH family protein [Acidobacteriaceae bacterium]